MIEVWTARLSRLRSRLPEWRPLLDAEEHSRADRFYREEDRERFVLAHSVLRLLLGRALGQEPSSLRFLINPFGKPQLYPLPAPPLHFNLSHSGDFVLIALSRSGPVGVDVERHRDDLAPLELGRDVFSEREYALLVLTPAERQRDFFFDLWSVKEAYLKARGLGLSLSPQKCSIIASDNKFMLAETLDEPAQAKLWKLHKIKTEAGYSAAAAFGVNVECVERTEFQG